MNTRNFLSGFALILFLAGCSGADFQIQALSSSEATATVMAIEPASTTTPHDTLTPKTAIDQLAFVSFMDGDLALYTIHSDGVLLTRLTGQPMLFMNPVWSRDGTKIAFAGCLDGSMATDCPSGVSIGYICH